MRCLRPLAPSLLLLQQYGLHLYTVVFRHAEKTVACTLEPHDPQAAFGLLLACNRTDQTLVLLPCRPQLLLFFFCVFSRWTRFTRKGGPVGASWTGDYLALFRRHHNTFRVM